MKNKTVNQVCPECHGIGWVRRFNSACGIHDMPCQLCHFTRLAMSHDAVDKAVAVQDRLREIIRILIACEFSGIVREAFRARGHDAWSCDLLPCDNALGGYHLRGDVFQVANLPVFDLMIAFPPCTHLCVSGAKWFAAKRASGEQRAAIDFFMRLTTAPIERIAIENPVGIMSTHYRKPDQIIQPWMFGHLEQKQTCLWLKGLPKLVATDNVKSEMLALPRNKRERLHYLPPSETRWKERSRTFTGIAKAMAEQWG